MEELVGSLVQDELEKESFFIDELEGEFLSS